MKTHAIDERRELILPGSREETLDYCVQQWVSIANESIADHGFFAVALSGGSTPKLIYQRLSSAQFAPKIDWSRVYLFWSDERSVPPDDPDSNYHMSLVEGLLETLPIPKENIFRMEGEKEIEKNAQKYEQAIKKVLGNRPFDLVMLGVGEDGHTASLFPHTEALSAEGRLVVANHVTQKNSWRMSFTFDCINAARNISLYVLGSGKAEILATIFSSPYDPTLYPSQRVGTSEHKAQWIIDNDAGKLLLASL